jgi:HEAT repeat protein
LQSYENNNCVSEVLPTGETEMLTGVEQAEIEEQLDYFKTLEISTLFEGVLKLLNDQPNLFLEVAYILCDEDGVWGGSDLSINFIESRKLLSPNQVQILLNLLEDFNYRKREITAKVLGYCNSELALTPLVKALADPSVRVKINAIQSLTLIGNIDTIPFLEQARKENDRSYLGLTFQGAVIRAKINEAVPFISHRYR